MKLSIYASYARFLAGSDACQGCSVALPKLRPKPPRGFLQTLMIVDIHKPDTSTLVTTGHFYFSGQILQRGLPT